VTADDQTTLARWLAALTRADRTPGVASKACSSISEQAAQCMPLTST
jgi:hypothetical protein